MTRLCTASLLLLASCLLAVPDALADEQEASMDEADAALEEEEVQSSAVSSALHEHHHTNPCNNVDCSGHGMCHVVSGLPVCACEKGYAPDTSSATRCVPAPYLEPPPVAASRPDRWHLARKLTINGMVLNTIGASLLVAGWPFAMLMCGWPECGLFGFFPTAALMYGIGTPLVLTGYKKAMEKTGRSHPGTLYAVGWALYAAEVASMTAMPFLVVMWSDVAFIVLPAVWSVFHLLGTIMNMVVAQKVRGIVRRSSGGQASGLTLHPYAAPVPGGAVAGIGLTF
jgi:hypothetical protein